MKGAGKIAMAKVVRATWLRGAALALLGLAGLWLACLGAGLPSEYEVKAAYLFNFAKFVDWPPEKLGQTNSPLVIGVVGENPFGKALETVIQKNQTVNGRPLVVRYLAPNENPRSCHILFVSRSEAPRLGPILKTAKGSAALTVSDLDQFLEQGGMIHFYLESDTVRFAVNLEAAAGAGLKLSPRLLKVAKVMNYAQDPHQGPSH